MDWDKLRIFHAVAEAGGLTQASESLHLSQSAVSRQIKTLEDSIGAPLFHRHPRGLMLTGEGEVLFASVKTILAELGQAEARIRDQRETLHGELRVTVTNGFGAAWLAPRLGRWLAEHPETAIDLLMTDNLVNIAMREADVAIRLRASGGADLIERPLMPVRICFYCAQHFLEKHKAPATLEDLRNLPQIIYKPDAPQPLPDMDWYWRDDKKLRRLLSINSHYGMLQSVREGLGVAALPDYMAQGDSALVRLLPDIEVPEYTLRLVYPVELRRSRRIAAFYRFLRDEIEQFQNDPAPVLKTPKRTFRRP